MRKVIEMTVELEFGKVTASKDVLNYLSLALRRASTSTVSDLLSESQNKDSDVIHDALKRTGYFNN